MGHKDYAGGCSVLELDPLIVSQIELIRDLLRDARDGLRVGLPVDLLRAVVLADVALESTLGLVVNELSSDCEENPNAKQNFKTLLQNSNHMLKVGRGQGLKNSNRCSRLHQTRNLAVHDGQAPSPAVAEELVGRACDSIRSTMKALFGLDVETFAPVQLLRSESLRELLEDAKGALSHNIPLAALASRFAIKTALSAVGNELGFKPVVHRDLPEKPGVRRNVDFDPEEDRVNDGLKRLVENVNEALGFSFRRTIAVDLGVSLLELERLRQFTSFGNMTVAMAGNVFCMYVGDCDAKSVPGVVDLAVRLVLSVERIFPSLSIESGIKPRLSEQDSIWISQSSE